MIVDEVHALAGTDRGAHLLSVIERIARCTENDIQRIGLSATVGNPQAIVEWLRGTSRRAGEIIDPEKQRSKRQIGILHQPTVVQIGREAARMAAGKKSLFSARAAP